MCFSKKLSMMSFLFGIFSSLMLIIFGNTKSYNANLSIGLFYIYVTSMQLVEYLIWSDLKCKNGLNKIGSLIGPLLNHFQPVILLILVSYYIKSNNIISNKILYCVNIIYIFYIFYVYFGIYMKEKLCTGLNKYNHLEWSWKYTFNYYIYYIVVIINIINYLNNKNVLIIIIINIIFHIISYYNFNHNIGEFWCLLVTSVPLILLFIQKVFFI